MSFCEPATSTPVMAGEFQSAVPPTCVVLIQVASVAVSPSKGAKLLATCTADCEVIDRKTPFPEKLRAAPNLPAATQIGFVVPIKVPVFTPAESAAMVPLPSSK